MGIGAKTSSGYGRMELLPEPIDPEMARAESLKQNVVALTDANVANQIHNYYQQWKQLTSQELRILLAEAIVERVRKAKREKQSADKEWYKELLAFLNVQN